MYDYDYPKLRIDGATYALFFRTIIDHLSAYDAALTRLISGKGTITEVNDLLTQPIQWRNRKLNSYFGETICLAGPLDLKYEMSSLNDRIGLDIRKVDDFPAYFLFYYRDYSYRHHHVLLKEIHRSKYYPAISERFVRVRPQQSDKMLLNAMPFREQLMPEESRGSDLPWSYGTVDRKLDRLAEILNLAWDEDFELIRHICIVLNIKYVMQSFDLLTVILSCRDLGYLKQLASFAKDLPMTDPELHYLLSFLEGIQSLDLEDWKGLVEQSKRHYVQQKCAIRDFFRGEVLPFHQVDEIPLWKIAFAHHSRPLPEIQETPSLIAARSHLEQTAGSILNNIQRSINGT